MGVELLILALLVPTVLTKWVQDNRTDREYARQGMVSPRYQERLKRLEKAGRPNKRKKAQGRGPLRSYLGELYADAMLDRVELHRQKRAHRGPVVYDPGAPKLRQRLGQAADGFDAAVLGGIRRVQESQGWDRVKTAAVTVGRRLVEPVGEKSATVEDAPAEPAGFTDREAGEVAGLPGETVTRRFDGQPETDADRRFFDLRGSGYRGWIDEGGYPVDGPTFQQTTADGRVEDVDLARTLAVYEDEGRDIAARQAAADRRLVAELEAADAAGELTTHEYADACEYGLWHTGPCGVAAADAPPSWPPTVTDEDETEPSTGGPTMTSAGEASNYETAVPALSDLQQAMVNLSDHVAGAEASADEFRAHVEEIDEAKTQVTESAQLVQDQMAAAGVQGSVMEQVNAAMEQVQQGDLASAIDYIEQAKQQLSDAKTAATEGAAAAGQAQDDLEAQWGETHARVADDLSGNGDFLSSGGGAPVAAGAGR